MLTTQYTWHKIADDENGILFQSNDMALVDVDGKKLGIGRYLDKLYAFAYKCPHASGILTDGVLDARGNIVCPTHGYRFNIQNGRNTTGEGYHLKHWPVEKRPDGIYVGLEEAY